MRFAYADPPYLGSARKHYAKLHSEAARWDQIETHAQLIGSLAADFDGFALSLSTPSLQRLLPLCPPDVRVMAWVKGFASWKPGVTPTYAWEPVILRRLRARERLAPTVRDWCRTNITTNRDTPGAKPTQFCMWLFDAAGLDSSDELVDIFPGSGAVTRAWEAWKRQRPFSDEMARGYTQTHRPSLDQLSTDGGDVQVQTP